MFAPGNGAVGFSLIGNDENLVFLADDQNPPALAELERRFGERRTRFVARLARDFGLNGHDIDEAIAEWVFWFLETLRGYESTNRRTFRSYLYQELNHRFQGYV